MSGKKQIYKVWEQMLMSEEKGSRIIHYYLMSTSASPLLAAVGTERSDRHFSYRVSKEFLETFGSSPTINAHTKWKTQEHVRDWLISFVRNDNLSPTKPDHHNVPTQEGNDSLDAIAGSESSGGQLLEPPIRLCPPEEEPPTSFVVGAAVDAWWNNGWRKGFVLTAVSLCSSDQYHVFFPGDRTFLILDKKDLRVSREWVDDRWVPIESQPDILSFIFSYFK